MMQVFTTLMFLLSIAANWWYLNSHEMTTVGFILLAAGCYLVAYALQLMLHECGHLIGGLCSGYQLVYLQFGWLHVRWDGKKLQVRFGASRGGQCVMCPKSTEERRFVAYNLGGILMNGVVSLIGLLLFLTKVHGCRLLAINLLLVGVTKVISNAVPHRKNKRMNDCYIVRMLRRVPDVQKDYVMYLRLFAACYRGEDIQEADYRYPRDMQAPEETLIYYHEIQRLLDMK